MLLPLLSSLLLLTLTSLASLLLFQKWSNPSHCFFIFVFLKSSLEILFNKFAYHWIRIRVLRCRKKPLVKMCHNHSNTDVVVVVIYLPRHFYPMSISRWERLKLSSVESETKYFVKSCCSTKSFSNWFRHVAK